MTVKDLINAGIEIQGNAFIKEYDEANDNSKVCSLYAYNDEMAEKEIKYIYAENGMLIFEI